MGEMTEKDSLEFNPGAPPPFRIGEIRAAIPKHCWVKNPWRSLAYVFWDIFVILALAYVALYFDSIFLVWPLYWAAQGTMFWAIFVVGHDWYATCIALYIYVALALFL